MQQTSYFYFIFICGSWAVAISRNLSMHCPLTSHLWMEHYGQKVLAYREAKTLFYPQKLGASTRKSPSLTIISMRQVNAWDMFVHNFFSEFLCSSFFMLFYSYHAILYLSNAGGTLCCLHLHRISFFSLYHFDIFH